MRRTWMLALGLAASATGLGAQDGAGVLSSWRPEGLGRAAFVEEARGRNALVRVTDHGAVPGDGRDDADALERALAAARARPGGVVLLPAGEYEIGRPLDLPSGVAVVGEGCGRTIVRRRGDARGQFMFRLDGVAGVRVQGVEFDMNHAREFYRFVAFRGAGSRDVVIADNCFRDSRPLTTGGDRWAVELSATASPSRRVWISGNRVTDWMQLTAGGGAGVVVLRIVDNTVRGAEANAIAVTHLPRGSVIRDVLIARNRIERTHRIGIYLGADDPRSLGGVLRDVVIEDNELEGIVREFGTGIFIRAMEVESAGITIRGNRLRDATSSNDTGIRIVDQHGRGRRRTANVLIEDNRIAGFERGVWLHAVDDARVRRNDIEGRRPVVSERGNRNLRVEPR